MTTKILKSASVGLIFLITFIPLYVDNSLFFPFITGKAFAFRILVEIAVALWLLLLLRDKQYAPRFSWISTIITAFVIVTFVADILGVSPIRSLWSNFERMEGWVTIAHLWAYFIVATSLFGVGEAGRRMWHNLFKTSLVVAGIVGIYGFFQLFGWAAIHQGSTRIDASLGNAAYMAVYMLMHTFMAFYLGLVAHEKRNRGAAIWYTILGVIFGFLLFETATRGTILGLAGGIMLALGLFAVFGKGENKKARFASGGGILLIILLGVALVAAKDTAFVKSSESLNRLASISWNENLTQARGYIWPMAVRGVFENPKTALIGWGQENFNYIFNANYEPKMWNQEQWFDRAHSVFLDWLVAGGLAAFLLYVSLFVFAIRSIWKSTLTFKEKCLLTGLFVAYAIHNVFVFDNLASYLLFFTMLGFTHSLIAGRPLAWLERKDVQSENMVVYRDYLFFPIILIALVGTLYFVNVRPLQANKRLIAAMTVCGRPESPDYFARALKLNQYVANQEIREQLISCAGSAIPNQSVSLETKNKLYLLAFQEINNQIKVTPDDARGYLIGGSFLNNISNWQGALPILEKANQLSPNKQSLMFELATNYLNSGKEKEATALLEKAYLLAPENENARLAYGSALAASGEDAKLQELFKEKPELLTDQRILNAYVQTKQYSKALAIVKPLVEKEPDNFQYQAYLATIYVEMGDKFSALARLDIMKEKFAYAKAQIEATIEQVKAMK